MIAFYRVKKSIILVHTYNDHKVLTFFVSVYHPLIMQLLKESSGGVSSLGVKG